MQLPIIKSYNGTNRANSFYVLCKGENSGRPMHEPCPNCFIVTCANADEYNYWQGLAWGIWKAKSFHRLLRGSVIPFIRICDVQEVWSHAAALPAANPAQLAPILAQMRAIEEREQSLREQLKLLGEYKIALFRHAMKC